MKAKIILLMELDLMSGSRFHINSGFLDKKKSCWVLEPYIKTRLKGDVKEIVD